MKESQRLPRPALVFGSIALLSAEFIAACGGGSAKAGDGVKIDSITPTAAASRAANPEPTVVVSKQAVAEAPKVLKTILDQPVVPVKIETIKQQANSLYSTYPDANGWTTSSGGIFPKQYMDNWIKECELGDPQDAGNAKLIAVDREGSCMGLLRAMADMYKKYGVEDLREIAVAVRSYFITQYPAQKDSFDSKLRSVGIN